MFEFAKLLLFISFGYSLIAFYEAPLPGIGVSFSNLITDQAHYFQSVLEARSFDNIYRALRRAVQTTSSSRTPGRFWRT